ncbi:MAG: HD-GYP domain-containing protein [Planctomycetota bacterium]
MPDDQAEIERLQSLVTRFAAKLGMTAEDTKALDIAASMLGVKRLPIMDILKKEGPLTPEDRDRMRENAGVWAEFAEKVDLLRELGVADYLEKYTEHWDGTGRPSGLAGGDIPLGARILSVCYHYNGMISDRAYRRALTTKRALGELTRLSGTVLDPDLVTVFVAAVQDERKSSRLESRRRAEAPGDVEDAEGIEDTGEIEDAEVIEDAVAVEDMEDEAPAEPDQRKAKPPGEKRAKKPAKRAAKKATKKAKGKRKKKATRKS